VLSLYVFLLSILFKVKAFKSLSIDPLKKLYSLSVLDGLNKQVLPPKKKLDDNFVSCQAVQEAHSVHIVHELQLTLASVQYQIKKGD
jgi:hypothetical protein